MNQEQFDLIDRCASLTYGIHCARGSLRQCAETAKEVLAELGKLPRLESISGAIDAITRTLGTICVSEGTLDEAYDALCETIGGKTE